MTRSALTVVKGTHGSTGRSRSRVWTSGGIENELFAGVAALEKPVRLSRSLEREVTLAAEAKHTGS